ncbi:NUDIX domain-containing protein [Patescibacteria group bacterium]|nr:NUDIX domain-containing protein [Patescibacteria group bacterium]
MIIKEDKRKPTSITKVNRGFKPMLKLRMFSQVARQLISRQPNRVWQPEEDPPVVLHNHDMKTAIIHIAICDNHGNALYDQPLMVENQGAVIVALDSRGRIGMVRVFRPVAKHIDTFNPRAFYDQYMWEHAWDEREGMEFFGRFSWELPGGMHKDGDSSHQQTAEREATEELGVHMRWCEYLGMIIPNTTFMATPQPVYLGRVHEGRGSSPTHQDEEGIAKVGWFSRKELDMAIADGSIFDAITMAALQKFYACERAGLVRAR